MAITVPSPQAAATKWSTRAQSAANDYKTAVQGAGQRWQDATSSAGQIWATEVQKAVANGRFENGVAGKAGEYQTMAATKGFQNYGGGVTAGANKYATKIGKVLGVISGITLPPPGPRNSPQNYSRSTAIGNALNAAKMSGAFN
jgi:hypothetical protein